MRAPDSPPPGRRPTRLIVDLGAITANAQIIKRHLAQQTLLMAVVKANGYGHGSVPAAMAAVTGGATFLGVATVSEALELRDAGIDTSVLVLGPSDPSEAPIAAANDVSVGVGDTTQVCRLLDQLESQQSMRRLAVHLKIDTGMRRFGIDPAEAPALALQLANHQRVELQGVYSHLADADAESFERMDRQIERFRATLASISELGIDVGIAHISNSAALLRNRIADFDMVRAGICLYGISPSAHVRLFEGMHGALEWRATVQHISAMAPGDRTGYGGTYVASEHERLALLPIGYADGFPRQLSNLGWASFDGKRLPIRGRVSMDQCAVGIPADVDIQVGAEVTVLGNGNDAAPSANELAEMVDTIGYEIVSRISRRVPVDFI